MIEKFSQSYRYLKNQNIYISQAISSVSIVASMHMKSIAKSKLFCNFSESSIAKHFFSFEDVNTYIS